MDIFYNTMLIENIYKAMKNIPLKRNGGKMLITHKAQVDCYKTHVWFDQKYITDLIDLKNIIKQYRVSYDILDEILIDHQEEHGMNNMHFRMHESGLHYYVPEDEYFLLVNTVTGNKESYSKQHIKAGEQARELYASLGYTSVKDYKRVIQCK